MCTREAYIAGNENVGHGALSTRVDLHCWKTELQKPSVPRSVHILSSRESDRVTNFMLVLAHRIASRVRAASSFLFELSNVDSS